MFVYFWVRFCKESILGQDEKRSYFFQWSASAEHWNFEFFGWTEGEPKKLKISVWSTGNELKNQAELWIRTKRMHSLQNHTQNHAFLVEQKAYFNRKREKLQEKSLEIFLAVSHVTDARNCRKNNSRCLLK